MCIIYPVCQHHLSLKAPCWIIFQLNISLKRYCPLSLADVPVTVPAAQKTPPVPTDPARPRSADSSALNSGVNSIMTSPAHLKQQRGSTSQHPPDNEANPPGGSASQLPGGNTNEEGACSSQQPDGGSLSVTGAGTGHGQVMDSHGPAANAGCSSASSSRSSASNSSKSTGTGPAGPIRKNKVQPAAFTYESDSVSRKTTTSASGNSSKATNRRVAPGKANRVGVAPQIESSQNSKALTEGMNREGAQHNVHANRVDIAPERTLTASTSSIPTENIVMCCVEVHPPASRSTSPKPGPSSPSVH